MVGVRGRQRWRVFFISQDVWEKTDFGCLEVEDDKSLKKVGDDEYRLFDGDELCLSVLHVDIK
ncbi:hypothetical protein Hanom_Chr11g00978261 [Helianthus anomalus]